MRLRLRLGAAREVGVNHFSEAPGIVMFRVTPGTHTYSLRYRKTGDIASFENIHLWVSPAS